MDDFDDFQGKLISPVDRGRPRVRRWGCLLAGLALLAFLLVGVLGLGLPYVFWHTIRNIQVMDGPGEVVLFVNVYQAMRYPGLAQEAPLDHADMLYKVVVTDEGKVNVSPLGYGGDYMTFNVNLFTVVAFPDGFYLVDRNARSTDSLLHVNGNRIELALRPDYERFLSTPREPGFFDTTPFDAISGRSGWYRLKGTSSIGPFPPYKAVSKTNRIEIGFRKEGTWEYLIAESTSETNPWSKVLLKVDSRRWKSYRSPNGPGAYRKPG